MGQQGPGEATAQEAIAGIRRGREVREVAGLVRGPGERVRRRRAVQPDAPQDRPARVRREAAERAVVPERARQPVLASLAGEPSHEVPAGRDSPFITTERSPSWASSPISAS
jgi:hypothetical protein